MRNGIAPAPADDGIRSGASCLGNLLRPKLFDDLSMIHARQSMAICHNRQARTATGNMAQRLVISRPMSSRKRGPSHSEVQAIVGRRIEWARELVEPNRSAAARLIGVDPSTLAKIEAGERAPSIFNILAFANHFRVSADYLLRGSLTGPGMDTEMALRLAAAHPELVPARKDT